jgi:hypothetical protein
VEKKLPTLKELEGKYEPEELKDLTDEEVLKVFEGVETVWDYNPTEEEQKSRGLEEFEDKIDYFRVYSYTEEVFLIDLYSLFMIREEEKRAEKYFNLLPEDVQERILEGLNHGY